MPTHRGHEKKNYVKEIKSSKPKKTRTKSILQTKKCPIEEITCKRIQESLKYHYLLSKPIV